MKTKVIFSILAAMLIAGSAFGASASEEKESTKEVKVASAPAKLVEILTKVEFSEGDVKLFFRVEESSKLIVYKLKSSNADLTSQIKKNLKGVEIDGKGYAPGNYYVSIKYVDALNKGELLANR